MLTLHYFFELFTDVSPNSMVVLNELTIKVIIINILELSESLLGSIKCPFWSSNGDWG